MKNSVAHFEIYGSDPDKLQRFYTGLFDWSVEPVPGMDYRLVKTVDTDGQGMPTKPGVINGGLVARPSGYNVSAWVNYVSVDSIEQTVDRAKTLGAKVTKDKAAVPGMGWFAMLEDPQGNAFAIWKQDPNAK